MSVCREVGLVGPSVCRNFIKWGDFHAPIGALVKLILKDLQRIVWHAAAACATEQIQGVHEIFCFVFPKI